VKVWLIEIGETLPIGDNQRCRLRRIGILARTLAEAGHEVTWWASTFDHYHKCHVVGTEAPVVLDCGVVIRPLRGCGYTRNLSIKRLFDYILVSVRFSRLCHHAPRPDVILCGFPSIELSFAAVKYGLKADIPVVLDIKDMWPEIFLEYGPRWVRPLLKTVLWPWFEMASWACMHATAVTGMTEAFVDWGVARGGRQRSVLEKSFPFGYPEEAPSAQDVQEAEKFWDCYGVTTKSGQKNVCYFGGLGHQLDMTVTIEAARKLKSKKFKIKMVLCGSGDLLDDYREKAAGLDNIIFPGWVDAAKIHVLMRRSFVGLDPLPERYDFLASINNKAIEYLSAGLPVVSSPPRGVLSDLLSATRTGMSHECGDHERLAEILIELCDHPEKQAKMSANARTLFESQFSAKKVYGEMKSYIEMIGSKKSQG
jgi:glycosyltransferase involved in cell wall biosynthesis